MPIVRSQDRKMLVVDNGVYCIEHNNIWLRTFTTSFLMIAEYSTEEKALKVLDMLEAYACNDLEKLHKLGYPYVSKTGGRHSVACIYEKTSYELFKSKAFQFPEDEKVEL